MRKYIAAAFILLASLSNLFCQDTNDLNRTIDISTPWSVDFADLDDDGLKDMVGVSYGVGSGTDIHIYLGVEKATYEFSETLTNEDLVQLTNVILEDVNDDGNIDIISVGSSDGVIYLNDGSASFTKLAINTDGIGEYNIYGTFFPDFNNDGSTDLFFGNRVHINNGSGTYSSVDRNFSLRSATWIYYNDDAIIDLLITDNGFFHIYNGNGDGTFSDDPDLTFDRSPGIENNELYAGEVIISDINQDDQQDILVYEDITKEFIIYLNEGSSFSENDQVDIGHDFFTVFEYADFNMDGTLDIISSDDSNNITYWPIQSDGTFGTAGTFTTTTGAIRGLLVKDVIGEDFDDIVIMNGSGTTLIYSDKLNVEITQTVESKIYDGTSHSGYYELSDEVETITETYVGFSEPQQDAGSYTVNLEVTDDLFEGSVSLNLEISKKDLTVTAPNLEKTYGDVNPEITLTYSGFIDGEDENDLDAIPTPSTQADETSSAGEYAIEISEEIDNNYSITTEEGTLTIEKADLDATALDATKVYGASNPTFTVSFSGFVNNDDENDLDSTPTPSTLADETSDAGEYEIALSSAEDNNYNFINESGTLTIDKAGVSANVADASRIYGESNPEFTISYSGFVNEDNESDLDAFPVASTSADESSDSGEYEISLSSVTDNNYEITNQSGVLTIEKAELLATPDNSNKNYGDENPNFTISYVGFVNDDDESDLETPPMASSQADETSNVGEYAIVLSDETDNNYVISVEEGILTINQALLSVSVSDVSIFQGEPIPDFEIMYSGFINSEDKSILTEQPTATTTATIESLPGQYPITLTEGSAANYSLEYENGILTINEPLSVDRSIDIRLFPNPTIDHIFVESESGIQNAYLIDLNGRVSSIKSDAKKLILPNVKSGIYHLKVEFDNNSSIMRKIIIK